MTFINNCQNYEYAYTNACQILFECKNKNFY